MNIFCGFLGHEPGRDEVWNRGYYFSRCGRCGADLIRSDSEWSPVPPGHRVVWKSGRHEHSLEPDYRRNLPVLYRAPQPPAVLPLGAWHRRLLLLASAAGGEACALADPAPEEEDRSGQYPWLLAVAAIAAAGLHVLISLSERR